MIKWTILFLLEAKEIVVHFKDVIFLELRLNMYNIALKEESMCI
jgi:hypothetical protein